MNARRAGVVLAVIVDCAAAARTEPAPASPAPPPEIQRLIAALAGQWSIRQQFAGGATGQGTEVWRPGPGGRSLIEDFQTRVGDRELSGLGIIWWDAPTQGYRVVWCGAANPRGCVVMSKPAKWEGGAFVVQDEFERDGGHAVYREVFSDIAPDSFTQTVFEGKSGTELKPKVTIHATRTAR